MISIKVSSCDFEFIDCKSASAHGTPSWFLSLNAISSFKPSRTNRSTFQVHDEVILEGPSESAEVAKAIVVECMSKPFYGTNILTVDLAVDAKCAQNWYAAK
jgi:hypothetical protein